jgi:hypothetical protein
MDYLLNQRRLKRRTGVVFLVVPHQLHYNLHHWTVLLPLLCGLQIHNGDDPPNIQPLQVHQIESVAYATVWHNIPKFLKLQKLERPFHDPQLRVTHQQFLHVRPLPHHDHIIQYPGLAGRSPRHHVLHLCLCYCIHIHWQSTECSADDLGVL